MRIAVSGVGVISAMGAGAETNLQAMKERRSGVGTLTLFPSCHDLPVGEVPCTDGELKSLLGIPAEETVSRTSLLGMAAAAEAVRDAALGQGLRVGLVSATSVGGMDLTERFFADFMQDETGGDVRVVAQHDPRKSTARIAAHCGIGGFSTTLSTACSSAANAVIYAARLITNGICDAVVAGGCDALSKFTLNGFHALGILDQRPCCPFDASRAGLNLGEGAGYIVLQSADTVTRTPYCFLTGYANANDAFHQTASSPDGEGACLAMKGALAMAGLSPREVDYINVHGTGTPNNDAAEAAALRRVFGDHIPPFSSTKPFTGHTLAAAGGIEAVYSVLALKHGVRYPNLHFETPIDGSAPVPSTEWEETAIRNVVSNSFGFGGNDSSLIFSL